MLHKPSLREGQSQCFISPLSTSRVAPGRARAQQACEQENLPPNPGSAQCLPASLSSELFLLGKDAGMLVLFSKILTEQESHTVL